jgi:hypothetical protein
VLAAFCESAQWIAELEGPLRCFAGRKVFHLNCLGILGAVVPRLHPAVGARTAPAYLPGLEPGSRTVRLRHGHAEYAGDNMSSAFAFLCIWSDFLVGGRTASLGDNLHADNYMGRAELGRGWVCKVPREAAEVVGGMPRGRGACPSERSERGPGVGPTVDG